jgi:hypothetical protein
MNFTVGNLTGILLYRLHMLYILEDPEHELVLHQFGYENI